jgi:DNA-binding NarL/FixJ family response regulator
MAQKRIFAFGGGKAEGNKDMKDLLGGKGAGLAVIRRLAETEAKVLATTRLRDPERDRAALIAGARGVVTKDKPGEVVLTAIRKVDDGQLWFERHVLERAVSRTVTRERWHEAMHDSLTARELEIVSLLGRGLKNSEIADRLHITTKTVRNHLSSAFVKLGVSDRLALVVHASQLGLVSIGSEALPPHRLLRSAGRGVKH